MVSETISRYRILNKLGAGGMGEVYLAEDTQLDRKVAIKFLPTESVADEQAKKRLVREARAAAKLDHPNICAIHEVGEAHGQSFIVMQYVDGETLANLIQRKPLELRESLEIAAQVADALAEAHSRGIIHRDIKPQNIMITARGQVKVLDFGLAKVARENLSTDSAAETESLLTEPGMIIGTVPYMSPEQVRGEPLDARSDIFLRAVLMGRVRQLKDTLNIQVDLVDANTGAQLWGEEYERKVSDVLAVKQAIAREVTQKLRLRLSGEEQQKLVRRDTTNAEAYQFYLRGRYFWNKRAGEGLKKAIEHFQQAIDHDPNYALGYVGLADCYLVLELYASLPASESLPKARAAADRALQIDDSLAEAHASSANIYQKLWRWAEAEAEYKRAISLNPNYPTAHHWFATYFRTKRQFDDDTILKELEERYTRREATGQHLAGLYAGLGDRDQAFAWLEKDFQQRSGQLGNITFWFSMEDIRSDPRYADLVRRMGLQP